MKTLSTLFLLLTMSLTWDDLSFSIVNTFSFISSSYSLVENNLSAKIPYTHAAAVEREQRLLLFCFRNVTTTTKAIENWPCLFGE